MQSKSPEDIVRSLKLICDLRCCHDEAWLRPRLSSLFRWAAEQMPEHTESSLPLPSYKDNLKYKEIDNRSCITEVDGAYNAAIDDCRCTLMQIAEDIWKE